MLLAAEMPFAVVVVAAPVVDTRYDTVVAVNDSAAVLALAQNSEIAPVGLIALDGALAALLDTGTIEVELFDVVAGANDQHLVNMAAASVAHQKRTWNQETVD